MRSTKIFFLISVLYFKNCFAISLELTPRTSSYPISWDAKPLNVSANSTHITNVRFTCTGTWCINEKVYEIYFGSSCNIITRIPKGLQGYFPNMVVISFTGCFIKTLENDDLKEYSGLDKFTLQGTLVERIPADFFHHTPRLTAVNLSDNVIRHVERNVFDDLQKLSLLNFDRNVCYSNSSSNNLTAMINDIYEKCSDGKILETTTISSGSCDFEDQIENKVCKMEKLLKEFAKNILETL